MNPPSRIDPRVRRKRRRSSPQFQTRFPWPQTESAFPVATIWPDQRREMSLHPQFLVFAPRTEFGVETAIPNEELDLCIATRVQRREIRLNPVLTSVEVLLVAKSKTTIVIMDPGNLRIGHSGHISHFHSRHSVLNS